MSVFSLLDVAIALVFFFLLLSLVVSAVHELIAALLKTRAAFLERGVIRLLGDAELKERLYNHPLIRNLWGETQRDLPSYIPSQNFALAIMDLALPGTGTSNALTPPPATPAAGGPAVGAAAPVATGRALLNAINVAEPAIEGVAVPASLKGALVSLIQAAGQDAALARKNIEDWYNSTMDRVSGAYKRRTQYWLFGIGLAVAIAINGDSVLIAKHLLANSTLTQQFVQAAQQYVTGSEGTTQTPAGTPNTGASGSVTPAPGATTGAPAGTAPDVEAAAEQLTKTVTALDGLGLPIGWNGPENFNRISHLGEALEVHWPGWLISAFAVSFGAPFWFDLLNRFMVVRSTVKPKEKSPEEESKD